MLQHSSFQVSGFRFQVSSLSLAGLRPLPLTTDHYGFTANPTALATAVCLMSKVRN